MMKSTAQFILVFFLFFALPNLLFSQEEVENPEEILIETEWFLTKLVIDGEEHPLIPDQTLSGVSLVFEMDESSNNVYSDFCEPGYAGFSLENTEDLYTWGWGEMAGKMYDYYNCNEDPNTPKPDNRADSYQYFYLFWQNDEGLNGTYHHKFVIYEDGNLQELILTSDNGTQAYYQNIPLATGNHKKDLIRIYPNPVKDFLHIENLTERADVKIYDLLGKQIFQQEIHSSDESLYVSNLSNGLYFYNVYQNGKSVKTGKLVKS